MGTKTVSLSEDAYERLKRLKKENESFSDVVRRVTGKINLRDFHGILGKESAEELEKIVAKERKKRKKTYENEMKNVKKELNK